MRQSVALPILLLVLPMWIVGAPPARAQTRPAGAGGEQVIRLPAGKDRVTVQLHRAGPVVLARGVVNGADAGWFVVDTGASGLIMDPEIAQRLKLPSLGRSRMSAVGGDVSGTTVSCDTFAIGDALFPNALAATASMRALQTMVGFPLAGFVGGEMLAASPVAIDFYDDTLTWYDRASFAPPPQQQGRAHELRLVRNIPHVRASLGGRDAWFALDTGAFQNAALSPLFVLLNRDLLDDKPLSPGSAYGVGGKVTDWSTEFGSLVALGRDKRGVTASFSQDELPAGAQRDVYAAGRIGILFFADARITADYAARKMWVDWRGAAKDEPLEVFLARARGRAARDVTKPTPLIVAANAARVDAIRALLDAGEDVRAVDNWGFTALLHAADLESPDCAAALLGRGADPNVQAVIMAMTPLHRAAEAGRAATVERLLAAGARHDLLTTVNQSPLLRAVQRGSRPAAAVLLRAGADASLPDKAGVTPLMAAAGAGDVALIDLLLDHKADVNARSGQETALTRAAFERKRPAVERLLGRGAKANLPNQTDTPLHQAAHVNDGDTVALLLAAGANPAAKDHQGRTPQDIAAQRGCARALRVLLNATAATAAAPASASPASPASPASSSGASPSPASPASSSPASSSPPASPASVPSLTR